MNNKWIRAAIPAILIHISVGTVYCWSIFKEEIAQQIKMSSFAVGWAFSLAIFFLGMSAAFAGRLVEKNIHKSSLISCICFTTGMIGTGITIKYLTGISALLCIYLFYGVIMGIGLGIGYLTPVKTLMLWFKENKGLATGISIMGFGLAKAIASPIMSWLQQKYNVSIMFIILGCFYFCIMFLGHILLRKPLDWAEPPIIKNKNNISIFKNKQFIGIWLMFFINIHCGLMIISYEKQILKTTITASSLLFLITIIPSITAGFNAFGRIFYSTLSDKLKQRVSIYRAIFISCVIFTMIISLMNLIKVQNVYIISIITIGYLFHINAGYGGGFSTLPALLSERYGMKQISFIHGCALSAWAIAGLTGNNLSEIILKLTGNYNLIFSICLILYSIALIICIFMVRQKEDYLDGKI